jgi:phthalate 4,5-dioxygenase oxygenase subunit
VLIPPNPRYNLSILNIPQDDTDTMFYFIAWSEGPGIAQDDWRKFCGAEVGIDLDRQYRSIRTKDNDYLQDRGSMLRATPGAPPRSHTGIVGIPNQDMAMWETMGPIADRSKERLGVSDVAIVHFRRIMVEAARTLREGGAAIGTGPGAVPHVALSSFAGIVPKTTDWKTLGRERTPPAPPQPARPGMGTEARAD